MIRPKDLLRYGQSHADKARRRFILNALLYFRPGILFRNNRLINFNSSFMFGNKKKLQIIIIKKREHVNNIINKFYYHQNYLNKSSIWRPKEKLVVKRVTPRYVNAFTIDKSVLPMLRSWSSDHKRPPFRNFMTSLFVKLISSPNSTITLRRVDNACWEDSYIGQFLQRSDVYE